MSILRRVALSQLVALCGLAAILAGCSRPAADNTDSVAYLQPSDLSMSATLANRQTNFLKGECLCEMIVKLLVVNTSRRNGKVTDFKQALMTGALTMEVTDPDGNTTGPMTVHDHLDSDFVRDTCLHIKSLETLTGTVQFTNFRWCNLSKLGNYEVRMAFKPEPKSKPIVAEPFVLKVIEITADNILSTTVVKVENTQPKSNIVPLIQQIQIDDKVYLYYRMGVGAKGGNFDLDRSVRIAELERETEVTVEGKYGSRSPLTIAYNNNKFPTVITKHVINSIDGMPWTEEEEKLRQERFKLAPKKD